jgi:hypothetical protein
MAAGRLLVALLALRVCHAFLMGPDGYVVDQPFAVKTADGTFVDVASTLLLLSQRLAAAEATITGLQSST